MSNSQSAFTQYEACDGAHPVDARLAQGGSVIPSLSHSFIRTLWIRRKMVLIIVASGTLISLLFALHMPSQYSSITTLLPPDSSSSSSSLLSLLSSAGSGAAAGTAAFGIKTPGALFIGILKSETAKETLVARFDLRHVYKMPVTEDACKVLEANTAISEDPRSGIITINVRDRNPVLASNLARGYVDELNRIVTNNSVSAAHRERVFLETRLKEIKQDLDGASKSLSQFSSKNKTIDMASQGKAMVDSGLKLQDQMAAARAELAGLRQSYSEDNVRIRAGRARIAELQREMDMVLGSGNGDKTDESGSSYPSISALPALGLTYADLERRRRVEEALWDAMTRQYETASVQEAKEVPTIRVLDPARVPQHKSGPARSSIVIMGGMMSVFLAGSLIFAQSFWDELDPNDERKVLAQEMMTSIPNFRNWIRKFPGIGKRIPPIGKT